MTSEDKRNATQRILQLEQKVPSHRAAPMSTQQLYEYMLEEGYNISKRTVERNLKELADIGYIDFEDKGPDGYLWRKTYVATKDQLVMESSSALLVVMAEKMLMNVLPPASWTHLEDRFEQARRTLDKSAKNKLRHWQDKLFHIQGSMPSTPDVVDTEIRKVVYDAILDEEEIELVYQGKLSPEPKPYTLNPLAIAVRDEKIYLIASKAETPEKLRIFHFHRMKSAKSNFKAINRATKDLDIHAFVDTNPTGAPIGEYSYNISLKVRSYAYEWFQRNRLKEQTFTVVDDEFYRVEFRSNLTFDLVRLVLRYSPDIIVEKPEKLRKMVIKRLEKSLSEHMA